MTFVDAVFLIVFPVSIAIGAMRGLSREIIGIVALVLALLLARALGPAMGLVVEDVFGVKGAWVTVLAFALVFIIVIAIGRLTTYLSQSFIKSLGLGSWEKFGGAGFGFLRALVLLMAFNLVVELTPFEDSDWFEDSYSVQMAYEVNDVLSLDWSVDDITDGAEELADKITEKGMERARENLERRVDRAMDDLGDEIEDLGDALDAEDAKEMVEEAVEEAVD